MTRRVGYDPKGVPLFIYSGQTCPGGRAGKLEPVTKLEVYGCVHTWKPECPYGKDHSVAVGSEPTRSWQESPRVEPPTQELDVLRLSEWMY